MRRILLYYPFQNVGEILAKIMRLKSIPDVLIDDTLNVEPGKQVPRGEIQLVQGVRMIDRLIGTALFTCSNRSGKLIYTLFNLPQPNK